MQNKIYTFGYEGLTIDAFITRLQSAGVTRVIDVRAMPLSRKKGFSKASFSLALASAGIDYVHLRETGCPKSVRDQYKLDHDWKAYTAGFLAYLQGQAETVVEVARLALDRPSCLVCFEADFNRCHRLYVANAASQISPLEVVHLTSRKATPGAALRAGTSGGRSNLQ